METIVVFDCETDRVFDRTRRCTTKAAGETRLEQIDEMQCTIACALLVPCDPVARLRPPAEVLEDAAELVCWRDECPSGQPFAEMLRAFDDAVLIYGFNQLDFDMPLLRKYYRGAGAQERYMRHRLKCVDVFSNVRLLTTRWVSLNDLLCANALPAKSGSGVNAVRLWDQIQMSTDAAEIADGRAALRTYCMHDVDRTTRVALLHRPLLPFANGSYERLGNGAFGMASALASAQCAAAVETHCSARSQILTKS